MTAKRFLFFFFLLSMQASLIAQEHTTPPKDFTRVSPQFEIRYQQQSGGEIYRPVYEAQFALQPEEFEATGKKSALLATALSLAIPGSGELYAGSYWTAPVFMLAEAAGWYANIDQNRKGDEKTTAFQAYADTYWDVAKYAQWLNENAKNFEGTEDKNLKIEINPDTNLPPWERVDWETMHKVEMAVLVFSHRLPMHGDQQYFELIGKYHQFAYGWKDKTEGDYNALSPHFIDYSYQRGVANDFYNTASTIVSLLILNHVLSAADAAWAALRFNAKVDLHSQIRIRSLPNGFTDMAPTATFSWRF